MTSSSIEEIAAMDRLWAMEVFVRVAESGSKKPSKYSQNRYTYN
jgi:hypothetical protein